ncbi:MAG: hypothetical protein O3C40_01890, partial [Planctomycetota bacterium]|nr:hypothetical protein [Planctomycetota bacterium]
MYKANDGAVDSNVVTVSIAVGGDFGARTNLEEAARGGSLLIGGLELAQPLTPGLALVYQSNTLPKPIVVVETSLLSSSMTPDSIDALLTFNGSAGTTYNYGTTGLSPGDSLRFALQADASSLATGHYDYAIDLTANSMMGSSTRTFTGSQDVVNRGGSAQAFGRGWQLAGLDSLVVDTGGALWVQSSGDALWFEKEGSGGYQAAAGDLTFSTLVKNVDNTFTLTDKLGIEAHFSSTGLLISREDRNGNTMTYTYTSGLLTKITDPFSRDTTFTYTSGQLTSVSDFASRTATLTYDGSGRLTKITQPDPDGAGPLTAPETTFTYDATSHQLTKVTNPLNDATQFEYGSHDRLKKITHPDANIWQLTALQTVGLPTGTTGNSLTAADPAGSVTDERSKVNTFRTDRFGNLTEATNPLGYKTEIERNQHGQISKVIEADPDGAQTTYSSPITIFGHDASGNVVYRMSPRGYSRTWTYTTTFNQVASATDELSRVTQYTYDTSGNQTKFTDGDAFEWTYTYDTAGRVTKETTPDPDGLGSLVALDTSFSYDTSGRLTTITNPDSTTVSFTYDSADNGTKITDERAKETTFVYDTLNRLTATTDRESATTSYAYDAVGQVTKITDALGNDTTNIYNSRGWVTKVTQPDPDGAGSLVAPETTYTYDATGNVTEIGYVDFTGSGGLWYSYDDAGRRTQQNGPGVLGEVITEYVYDNLGRVTKLIDPLDTETRYKYDSSGNVIQVMQVPSGLLPPDDVGPATQYAYNADERLAHVTDESGYQTSYTLNDRGLLERTTLPDPDGSGPQGRPYTLNTYDNMGRLIEVSDQLRRKTTYEYDSRSRVTKVTEPDPDWGGALAAPVTTSAYDNAGRVTSVTDPLSRVTSFLYDDEGRVTKVTAPDPDGAGAQTSPETGYAYNDLGKVTSVTDALDGVTAYEYDNLRRVTKMTQPDPDGAGSQTSPITTYAYNDQGKLDKITDPLGRDTTFSYDNQGRRTGVADDSGNTTSYTYNVLNQVTKMTLPDPDDTGPLTAPFT